MYCLAPQSVPLSPRGSPREAIKKNSLNTGIAQIAL